MSTDFSLNADMAREKLYGLAQKQKQQVKQEEQQQQNIVKQEPSTSGLQWAQAQAAQQTTPTQKPGSQNVQNQTKSPQIVLPDLDDVAILSTAVPTKEEAVTAPTVRQQIISRMGIDRAALEGKFKENYRQSKSHNLLLERFMANIKLSGLNAMLSIAGFSSEQIENIKSEVRQEALGEIDSKLKQDWAYAKAMIEIMG